MSESESNATNGLVVRRRLSLRERMASSQVVICMALIALILGALSGIVAVSIGIPMGALGSQTLMTLLSILVGASVGIMLVATVAAGTAIGSNKRRKLMELQKRLAEQDSDDLCTELQKLVQGYLELKEFQVADHYSAMLLKQSALPPAERATKLSDVISTMGCWASTPEYHQTPNYWFIWLFQARGRLIITSRQMQFTSKRLTLDIDLADIRNVETRHHSRWLKPFKLNYIVVTFLSEGAEHDIYLTPSFTEFDSIADINRNTEKWVELIKQAQQRRIASRTLDKMRAQIPGVGSSSEQKV